MKNSILTCMHLISGLTFISTSAGFSTTGTTNYNAGKNGIQVVRTNNNENVSYNSGITTAIFLGRNSRINPLSLWNLNLKRNGIMEEEEKEEEKEGQKEAFIEKEILQLKREKEQKEIEVTRLKFQLNELSEALEISEKKVEDVNRKMKSFESNSNSISQIQQEFSKEKESLLDTIRSLEDDLTKVSLKSRNDLQQGQQRAEQTKRKLESEIKRLSDALEDISFELEKTRKEAMEVEQRTSQRLEKSLNEILEMKAREKDDASEIQQLLQERDQTKEEAQLLKQNLDDLKYDIEESQKREQDAIQLAQVLREETEKIQQDGQNIISKMKSAFSTEKDTFIENITNLKNELDKVKNDSKQKTTNLESEVSNLKASLLETSKEAEEAKKQSITIKSNYELQLKNQKDQSERIRKNSISMLSQEKKGLKYQVWELESKLQQLEVNIMEEQKLSKQLKMEYEQTQTKLEHVEKSYIEMVEDLEKKLKEEMEQSERDRKDSKGRMQGLVQKFSRRIDRRGKKASTELKTTKTEMDKQLDVLEKSYTLEKRALFLQHATELTNAEKNAKAELASIVEKYDTIVLDMNNEKNQMIQDNANKVAKLEQTRLKDLKAARIRAEQEIDRVVQEKDIKYKEFEKKSIMSYANLKEEMQKKLTSSLANERKLMLQIENKDMLIRNYEEERASFRKLLRMAFHVSREKTSRFIKRKK